MENTIIENKKGFKETKLGWIPEDWEIKKLGDLCTTRGEYGINASAVPFKKDLPAYLRITDIDENGQYVKIKKVSVDDINYKKFILKDGDIVFARTGATVGKTYLYNDKDGLLVYAGFLIKFNPDNEKLNRWYLKHFTDTHKYWNWVKVTSVRSGQPGINGVEYSTMNLPIPSLPEQKAIANCLGTWDAAITKQDALIKEKQQLKKALMQQLLSGKKRLSGFSEQWKEKRLDFFFDERSKRNNKGSQLLSIGEAGVYPQDNSNKKDTSNNDKSKYKKICVGDIGYNTMRMWQGRSALSSLEGIVSPAYTIVKPKENTDSQFFAYLFKDPAIIHRFFRNSQGMVSDTLNCKFKDFAIIKLVLPTNKEEQIAIAQVLKTADQEISLLTSQRNQLQLQKKGLMQQLLTGKKRLKI